MIATPVPASAQAVNNSPENLRERFEALVMKPTRFYTNTPGSPGAPSAPAPSPGPNPTGLSSPGAPGAYKLEPRFELKTNSSKEERKPTEIEAILRTEMGFVPRYDKVCYTELVNVDKAAGENTVIMYALQLSSDGINTCKNFMAKSQSAGSTEMHYIPQVRTNDIVRNGLMKLVDDVLLVFLTTENRDPLLETPQTQPIERTLRVCLQLKSI
jgi:hypothetical protein